MRNFIILLIALAGSVYAEDDIREKVIGAVDAGLAENIIEPNVSFFGHKVGTSEDAVFEKIGKPQAYLRLNERTTAALYDETWALIFTEGKLTGLRMSSAMIDYRLIRAFSPGYRNKDWALANGVRLDMTLTKVKKLIGAKLKPGGRDYHRVYRDGASIVHLHFSHHLRDGDSDDSYRVSGIFVLPADLPKKVLPVDRKDRGNITVVPNDSFLGHKIGITEDALIEKIGKPQAYMRSDPRTTIAIYENSRAFIFVDHKLAGLRLTGSLIDYQMREAFMTESRSTPWELGNGVRSGMSLKKIKQLVGDTLKPAINSYGKYHHTYKDGASIVHLHFSHRPDERDGDDEAYYVIGILVVPELAG